MMIMLLNLLIGIMGDSFDRVRSEEEAEFLKGKAIVIDDFEAGLSDDEIEELEYGQSSFDVTFYGHCVLTGIRLGHISTLWYHWKSRKSLTHGLER